MIDKMTDDTAYRRDDHNVCCCLSTLLFSLTFVLCSGQCDYSLHVLPNAELGVGLYTGIADRVPLLVRR